MAADTSGDSDGAGCGQWGCGCLGAGAAFILVLAVGYWFFNHALFYYSSAAWGLMGSVGFFFAGSIGGAFLGGGASLGPRARRRMRTVGLAVLLFGAVSLITVIVMTLRPGFHYEGTSSGWKTPTGTTVRLGSSDQADDRLGLLGPIEVPRGNINVGVRAQQEIEDGAGSYYQRWNFITVTLLDENKEYLMSFGGDVWNYAGYDDGEHWEETDESFQTTLRIPSPGTYFVRLEGESSRDVDASALDPIHFELYERASWGNPWPFRMAAYLAFFFGALLYIAPKVGRSSMLREHLESGGRIRFDGQVWDPRGGMRCDYGDWKSTEWTLQPTEPGARMPRYLEREYEADSEWENWVMSRPVEMDDLLCTGSDGEERTVSAFADGEGTLPEAVTYEGQTYTLEDAGRADREGASFPYHNYEDDGDGFVTIEGDPGSSLDAVVGRSVSVSEMTAVEVDA